MHSTEKNKDNNSWKKLITFGDTFTGRSGHTSIYDRLNTLIYVFGGFNGQNVLNDMYTFDIA